METKQLHELIKKSISKFVKEENSGLKCGIFYSVNDAVMSAHEAYKRYSKLTLNERREIIDVIRQRLLHEAEIIAHMEYEETGMGNENDKTEKMIWSIKKTPGIEDLITDVKTDDNGMTLYELSPYGVVCAIHPCTNPCATLVNNTISILASGNAAIHCPHPRACNVSKYVTEIISTAIRDVCGIDNLVVTVEEASMAVTKEIMTHPDVAMVLATGGSGVLAEAIVCGKKIIGGGSANPVVIVDETADIKKAARDIVDGASFDNNIMCISEKNIVAVSSIADELVEQMKKNGAYYINTQSEMLKLTAATVTQDFQPNKLFRGKDANELLIKAGIKCDYDVRLIVVDTVKQHPFVTAEMLMPIIPLVRVPNFETALETAVEIEQGFRHTAIIHSQSIERLSRAAKELQTSVFVKNGPSYAGIGFRNDGETSLTVAAVTGEGTVTARHFARRRRCVLVGGFSIR